MRLSGFLLAASIGMGLASSALAGQITMNNPGGDWRDGSGWPGGAFRATVVSGFNGVTGGPGGTSDSFLTFCLEYNENFSFGTTYNTVISDRAQNGGNGPSGDLISGATKAMYAEFRRGGNNTFGISGLNVGGGGDLSNTMRALQNAIWFEEGEIESLPSGLATTIWNWGTANSANAGLANNVRVLQLWNLDGSRAQDQLTLIPLPSAAAAGLSLLGVGAMRRRRATV